MKALLFDVKSLLRNSIYIKEIRAPQLNDQFHFHNAYEIALIIKGSGIRIVGDNVENFTDGDLIIMGPNIPHANYTDKKYYGDETMAKVHSIVVYFLPDWIAEAHMKTPDFAPIRTLLNHLKRGLKIKEGKTYDEVVRLLLGIQNLNGTDSFINLFKILNEISRSQEYQFLTSPGYSNTYDEYSVKKLHEVYKYVMENFTDNIELDNIASIAHMTPSAFCRYFKTATNKTFTHFVNEIRIGHACELLMDANTDISDICFSVGFNNFTNFNKNFRKFTNKTPSGYRSEFRSSMKGNNDSVESYDVSIRKT